MKAWVAVGIAGAATFYTATTSSMINVSLHAMKTDLHASDRGIGLVVSAYLVCVCVLLLPAGRVVDRIGPARAIPIGAVIASVAACGCGFAPILGVLVASRVVMAAGASLLMASSAPLVVAHVPVEQRGRALGVQAAMTYVGLVVGPSIGGALSSWWSWRGIFFFSAALALSGGLLFTSSPSPRPSPKGRGSGKSNGNVGFWIAPALAAAALHYAASFILSIALPLRLGAEGMAASRVGALFTLVAVAMALAAPVSGMLVDRVGARIPATASLLVASASLFAIVSDGPHLHWLLAFGLGAGMFATANTTAVMANAPGSARGIAASWLALARNGGMALGSVIGTGLVYSRAIGAASGVALAGAALAFVATSRRDVGPA